MCCCNCYGYSDLCALLDTLAYYNLTIRYLYSSVVCCVRNLCLTLNAGNVNSLACLACNYTYLLSCLLYSICNGLCALEVTLTCDSDLVCSGICSCCDTLYSVINVLLEYLLAILNSDSSCLLLACVSLCCS